MTGYVTENQLVNDRSVGFLFISYVIYLLFFKWRAEKKKKKKRERERERRKTQDILLNCEQVLSVYVLQ